MLLTGSLARKFSIDTIPSKGIGFLFYVLYYPCLKKHCVLTHCTVGVVPDLCLEFSH